MTKARSTHHSMLKPVPADSLPLGNVGLHHGAIRKATSEAQMAIEQDLQHRQANRVSAILVFTRVGSHLRIVMSQLLASDFIDEIVLWQDSGAIDKKFKEAYDNKIVNGKTVKFHMAEKPLKQQAKYRACASLTRAENSVCYYQAVFYDSFGYLKSLYSNYLRAPELTHTVADPITYFHDTELTFIDVGKRLHAGYAYMEYGAMFSKTAAAQFLVEATSPAKGEEKFKPYGNLNTYCDTYFTLWNNNPPSILSNKVKKFHRELAQPDVIHRNSYQRRMQPDQLRAEEDSLSLLMGRLETRTTAPAWVPHPSGYAACADDRCLFTTNMLAMPPPVHVTSAKDALTRLRSLVEVKCDTRVPMVEEKCIPPRAHMYAMFSYHHAVDLDRRTLWVSHDNATEGSYFGLDLQTPRKDLQNITSAHPFQKEMVMEVSMTGQEWYAVSTAPEVTSLGQYQRLHFTQYVYQLQDVLTSAWLSIVHLADPDQEHDGKGLPPLYIRYVRFVCPRDMAAPFVLSEVDVDHEDDETFEQAISEKMEDEAQMWVDEGDNFKGA
eukprot:CAMPEP_0114570244 /NCGR_PEP_ID=MMETSP0114-20121206/17091_1 /TAXON_ID=31324 /ORGANISM="Goniomonas sp, Strain m" /LENGTH=549 /DNA_ID=CAMNT_0001757247 /DNA_START=37 /DNA_END=1686 /DNA_ORIENTATION=-